MDTGCNIGRMETTETQDIFAILPRGYVNSDPFLRKALLCTNVLNDVTVTLFLMSFSQLPAVKKDIENGAAVRSLRTFVRSSAFILSLDLLSTTKG